MPVRPRGPCSVATCPRLAVARGRCSQHQPATPPRPVGRAAGYDEAWAAARAAFLAANPVCRDRGRGCQQRATEAHHDIPKRYGGRSDASNLIPLCKPCHSRRTALGTGFGLTGSGQFAIRTRDVSRRSASVVIHVCGAPATGKTELSAALEEQLGLPCLGIDQQRARQLVGNSGWVSAEQNLAAWCRLEDRVDALSPCIVETSGVSPNDTVLLSGRRVLTIVCVASEAVRRARLQARVTSGYQLAAGRDDYVDRLLWLGQPTVEADHVYDTTVPSATALRRLVGAAEAWLARQRQQ